MIQAIIDRIRGYSDRNLNGIPDHDEVLYEDLLPALREDEEEEDTLSRQEEIEIMHQAILDEIEIEHCKKLQKAIESTQEEINKIIKAQWEYVTLLNDIIAQSESRDDMVIETFMRQYGEEIGAMIGDLTVNKKLSIFPSGFTTQRYDMQYIVEKGKLKLMRFGE